MKVKLIIALVAGFLGLFEKESDRLFQAFGAKVAAITYDRSIHVSGNGALSEDFLVSRIDPRISNFSLVFSPNSSLEQIRKHPLVQTASLERCDFLTASGWPLSCFTIRVLERHAQFVATLDGNAQLLANDGRVIASIKKELLGEHLQSNGVTLPALEKLFPPGRTAVPLVVGLQQFADSPDTLQQSFRFAANVLVALETERKASVAVLTFKNATLVDVRFADLQPTVRLTLASSANAENGAKNLSDSKQELQELVAHQLERLQMVQNAIGETISAAEKIDVGFSTQAVVTLAHGFGLNQPPEKASRRNS